jgi:hypothetical protein
MVLTSDYVFFMFLGRKLEPASADGGASPSMRRA